MMILVVILVLGCYALYSMNGDERTRLKERVVLAVDRTRREAARRRAEPEPFRDALVARTPWPIVMPVLVAVNVLVFLGMGWGGTESILYYAKLKKRLALGLADPLVTDRLRLWGIAMGCAFASTAIAGALRAAGVKMTGEVTGLFVGPLGIASAAAMWLAFLPPHRYVNWVLARARAGA